MLFIPSLHCGPRDVLLRVSNPSSDDYRSTSGNSLPFLVLTGTQKSSLVSCLCRICEVVARGSHTTVSLLNNTAAIERELLVSCVGEVHRANSLAFD
jgi:hypothetical protein